MKRIVDLTATIGEDMIQNAPFHPRAPLLWLNQRHDVTQWYYDHIWRSPELPPLFDGLPPEAGMPGKGHGEQSEQIILGTHMGTHIDAPRHFAGPDYGDATTIPIEKCVGDALLLDLRPYVRDDDGHAITLADLDAAERDTGDHARPGDIVLLNTGHAARHAYGPRASKADYAPVHPGLDYDTAPWFIKRRIAIVGCDTANLDRDRVEAAHVNFLLRPWIGKEPIYIVENLVRLEEIGRPRFTFVGLPLPMVGASGSPIRAIAIVDD